jgi:integrase
MARSINKLTDRTVRALSEYGNYADGNGVYLQVSKWKTKSWIFRYTIAGKRRAMGLGGYPETSLAEARRKAAEYRMLVKQGIDPITARQMEQEKARLAQIPKITFQAYAINFVKDYTRTLKNKKHAQQWNNTLSTYAYPVIGDMAFEDITTEHIKKILKPIWYEKTETASRVRGRIEKIWNAAKVEGICTGENPARWKGHLEQILPAPTKVATIKAKASLPYEQVPAFMQHLQARAGTPSRALEFAIYTACRQGEVTGARWEEIDLVKKTWAIPAERMKLKRPFVVALSDEAVNLLKNTPRLNGVDYVFPNLKTGKKLSENALNTTVRKLGYSKEQACAHGFRASFRTWAAEQTNYPNDICEYALSHVNKDRVEAAYQRSDMLEKRFSLMNDWSKYINSHIETKNS